MLKDFLKTLWTDHRAAFYFLLASLLMVLLMIIVVATSDASSSKQCKSICKVERQTMIKQCIEDEGKYWDGIEEPEIHRQCDFLTYYSYIDCVEQCTNPNKNAIIFYDQSVKNFPLEN